MVHRDAFAEDLSHEIALPIPFTDLLVRKACGAGVKVLASIVEEACQGVYQQTLDAIEAKVAARDAAEWLRHNLDASPEEKAALEREAEATERAYLGLIAHSFTERVHEYMLRETTAQLPRWLSGRGFGWLDRLVEQAVQLALERTFQHERMNTTATYLFDQHLRSRRLGRLPPGSHALLLRKKEEILGALLAMDRDDDGFITSAEFVDGVMALGLDLSRPQLEQLVLCLDLDENGLITARELSFTFFGTDVTADKAQREELCRAAAACRRQLHQRAVRRQTRRHQPAEQPGPHEAEGGAQGGRASLRSWLGAHGTPSATTIAAVGVGVTLGFVAGLGLRGPAA